jgi:hypothetical protein
MQVRTWSGEEKASNLENTRNGKGAQWDGEDMQIGHSIQHVSDKRGLGPMLSKKEMFIPNFLGEWSFDMGIRK